METEKEVKELSAINKLIEEKVILEKKIKKLSFLSEEWREGISRLLKISKELAGIYYKKN